MRTVLQTLPNGGVAFDIKELAYELIDDHSLCGARDLFLDDVFAAAANAQDKYGIPSDEIYMELIERLGEHHSF